MKQLGEFSFPLSGWGASQLQDVTLVLYSQVPINTPGLEEALWEFTSVLIAHECNAVSPGQSSNLDHLIWQNLALY